MPPGKGKDKTLKGMGGARLSFRLPPSTYIPCPLRIGWSPGHVEINIGISVPLRHNSKLLVTDDMRNLS
jgi:hypothetical protein